MKILFFSTVFRPSVGGIETLAEILCTEFVRLGHEVQLVTTTGGSDEFSSAGSFFKVIRNPNIKTFWKLLVWSDIHIQANVSLKHAWPRIFFPGKFIYQHNTAYLSDSGTTGFLNFLKKKLARYSRGIAVSDFVARSVGVDQVVHNAYQCDVFVKQRPWNERKLDLVFVGRLVSQKGCETLLSALFVLSNKRINPSLTIVGDGPDRARLENLTADLGLSDKIIYLGVRKGIDLAQILNQHKMIVVPSLYSESFGIVALEGLACGCLPLVSNAGGLVEAVGKHCLTFSSGNPRALAQVISDVLAEPDRASEKLKDSEKHLIKFTASAVAEKYLEAFRAQN